MPLRITILGGGHGVAAVLRALGGQGLDLDIIVTVADDGGSSGELRRHWGIPAVGDMRRSLIALAGEEGDCGRALAAPVTIAQLGRHPLGNLLLSSLTRAFGDLPTASEWLSGQLGLAARVLPATAAAVTLVATSPGGLIRGEEAIGAAPDRIQRLRFDPPRPEVPTPVIEALERSDWVLLAPGSLFTSLLAVSALPDVTSALTRTRAHVLWLCNLEPQIPETSGMSANDHLAALRRHGVRVDLVLYDPAARLTFTAAQLASLDLPAVAHPLMSADPGRHDPSLLAAALDDVFSGVAGQADRAVFIK